MDRSIIPSFFIIKCSNTIYSHWGEPVIRIPLGVTTNCSYSQRNCILNDKTVLEWVPNKDQFCRYIKFGECEGKLLDNT